MHPEAEHEKNCFSKARRVVDYPIRSNYVVLLVKHRVGFVVPACLLMRDKRVCRGGLARKKVYCVVFIHIYALLLMYGKVIKYREVGSLLDGI